MVKGKKNKKLPLNEKFQPFVKANCSASARNLGKKDLGAVVFGCKNHTINECYSSELFGLPAPHFAYVKNITPGLVLFLFNYSDRTLHGIFEATSSGRMYINRHGWTDDGAELTPYPAQVQVRIQRRCCTLTEDQFRPIISSNYYEKNFFWFELDRSQASKLVSLFESLPCDADALTSKNTTKRNTSINLLPALETRQEGVSCLFPQKTWTSLFTSSSQCDGTHRDDESNSIPQKTWCSLFKTPSDCDGLEKENSFWTEALNSCHPLGESKMELESSCVLPSSNRDSTESEGDALDSRQCSEEVENWETYWENPPSLPVSVSDRQGVELDASECYDDLGNWESDRENLPALKEVSKISLNDNALTGEARHGVICSKPVSSDINSQYSEESNMVVGLRLLNVDGVGTQSSESSDCGGMISEENNGKDATHTSFSGGVHTENVSSPTADRVTATSSSDIQSVVVKLMKETEGLKLSQLKQSMKINLLEKKLFDSNEHIAQLKNRCNMLESGKFSSVERLGEEYVWIDKFAPNMNETVLIVGGFDGSSWLADLNSYCPSRDIVTSLCSMTTRRSYASAAKLGGELFIFGGIDGNVWYDTVESYNLRSDQWASRPSLNRKKGSLAGVNLSDKIFAIGGGNGVDCLAEVEMYDPNIGRWIFTQSMQSKRFAPAASEMNNALYVTGGYDGTNYLSTVERFDPREHLWVRVGNMSTKRGCHSVAVLHEKLYAMGGCDGNRIHSTVEIFDPRMNLWTVGDSMNNNRGYSGAVVVGGKIYVIGGLKENDEILDTIECYKEGYGWEVNNLNALGKRCFFSALVF